MNRMLELIQGNAVPPPILKKALAGQLAVPVAEQIQILAFLATQQAHASEALQTLTKTAQSATNEDIELLLSSHARSMEPILRAILDNPNASDAHKAECRRLLGTFGAADSAGSDDLLGLGEIVANYEQEHADEIKLEEGKRFEITRGNPDEQDELAELLDKVETPANQASATPSSALAKAQPEERERVSVLQKIARLRVGERVQLAMKGNKDERFVLIRDGARVVSLAVLESPKLTDSEVESFAAMKNVQEAVLRGIAAKRSFMKKYAIVRSLVTNPKTPLDLGLSLLPHLIAADLKNLSVNKNVGETLRKVAAKLWRDKQKKN